MSAPLVPIPLDSRKALGPDEIVRRLPPYFTISVASKRNSGKSFLCRQLVQMLIKQKKVDVVIVMSGSAGLNDDWEFVKERDPKAVMEYSEEILQRIFAKQAALVRTWVAQGAPKGKGQLPTHVCVVLDDCLSSPEALRSPTIGTYYTKGRHVHASMICISQHTSHLLTPILRANSDIILWSKLNLQQLVQLWESTTNIERKDFIRISESIGGHNYCFLLLDNITQTGEDPLDFLSVIRAVG